MANEPAKFIHGDRTVYMIDVPVDELDDFVAQLQEQFGKPQAKFICNQIIDELEQKKGNDTD